MLSTSPIKFGGLSETSRTERIARSSFPLRFRITVIQISAGSKGDASLVPELSPAETGRLPPEDKKNAVKPAVKSKE